MNGRGKNHGLLQLFLSFLAGDKYSVSYAVNWSLLKLREFGQLHQSTGKTIITTTRTNPTQPKKKPLLVL